MHFNQTLSRLFLVIAIAILSARSARADQPVPTERTSLYEAVNGQWLAATPIPSDQPGVTNFQVLTDAIRLELQTALEETIDPAKDSDTTVKAKTLYRSFLETTRRDDAGLDPIEDDLESIDDIETYSEVALHFAKFLKVGISSPFLLVVGPNFRDSNASIIWAVQNGLGMPARAMYLDQDERSVKLRSLYQGYLAKLFALADISRPDKAAADVLELETALAKIQWSPEQMHDVQQSFSPHSFAEFERLLGKLPIADTFKQLGLSQSYQINANQKSYLEAFNTFFESRSVDSWKEYLRARLLTGYAPLLTSEFHAAELDYQKALGMLQDDVPLWKRAVGYTESCSSMLLGKLYVERYFSDAKKTDVQQIVAAILASAKDVLSKSQRLSPQTRTRALTKLSAMTFNIGYPEQWQDFTKLSVSDDVVENFKNAAAYNLQREYDKLAKPVDRNEWDRSPHEVNAFYDPTKNKFVLLAGILKPPFYEETGSVAERFGGLGFVVGHEIGHAFDDSGSQFDGAGNLANWWTDQDRQKFDVVKKGYIRQANAFEVLPGVRLNGEVQIGEIMGDATGAKLAINALDKAFTGTAPARQDAHRAFYRQLAKVWREHYRPEVARLLIATDPHPAGKFRTDGIVQNMPQFHAAFGTKPKDAMYRSAKEQLQIW